jgi:hypothetical protein
MALRPLDQPLAWVGGDRLLCDDTSPYGLRRLVYARKGECPDADSLLRVARWRAEGAPVHCWAVEDADGIYWYLWICWKEKEG